MREQIQKFLIKENISPSKFADVLGIQRSSISHILSGRNNPGYDLIIKIIDQYDRLNPEWLLTGKGNMYKSIDNNDNISKQSVIDYKPKMVEDENAPIYSNISNDTNVNSVADRKITNVTSSSSTQIDISKSLEKVLLFYSDGSFEQYIPSK